MANATINVTACDNELYLIAVNSVTGSAPTQSYQLVHIESGNSQAVNVTATVSPGAYFEPGTLNGVTQALNSSYPVSLPAGSYNLIAVGINWGLAQQFTFTLNGVAYSLPYSSSGSLAVAWTPAAVPFSIS
jgi:hypothetical protein